MNKIIETQQLTKTFYLGDIAVHALRGIDLSVKAGELVAIMGSSGSGKSTFMNLLGCLDQPTSGDYFLDGINVNSLKKDEYAEIRNHKIGFVFQGFNLLPRTSALENVELPLFYDRALRIKNPKQAAIDALERVALAGRMDHEPSQLSGGEQQRVAIARALVHDPLLVLADEPTGNLDEETGAQVLALLDKLTRQSGKNLVMVTHSKENAIYADRIFELQAGCLSEVEDR